MPRGVAAWAVRVRLEWLLRCWLAAAAAAATTTAAAAAAAATSDGI